MRLQAATLSQARQEGCTGSPVARQLAKAAAAGRALRCTRTRGCACWCHLGSDESSARERQNTGRMDSMASALDLHSPAALRPGSEATPVLACGLCSRLGARRAGSELPAGMAGRWLQHQASMHPQQAEEASAPLSRHCSWHWRTPCCQPWQAAGRLRWAWHHPQGPWA